MSSTCWFCHARVEDDVSLCGPDPKSEPFFSAGGQWVGFWNAEKLMKVPAGGGALVVLCDVGNPYGPSWGPDDTIVFGQGERGIFRVSANGGAPEVLIEMDSKGED
jgi:hypothetical protein